MDLVFKLVQLKDLETYGKSTEFLSFNEIPISSFRIKSYLNNPNAELEDFVLFMACLNNQIVAYRTIWADTAWKNNTPVKFGWLSGNWVHENHRRKGVSSALFKLAFEKWDGKLAYTNYAPNSKKVYDKTNQFLEIKKFNGTRFYYRFSVGEILSKKSSFFLITKRFWASLDFILNSVKPDFKTNFTNIREGYTVSYTRHLTNQDIDFITKSQSNEVFRRELKEWNWIFDFPWTTNCKTAKLEQEKYYFTVYSNDFKNEFIRFKKGNEIVGLLMYVIRNRNLKVQYLYTSKNLKLYTVAQYLKQLVIQHKINFLSLYDHDLISYMKHEKGFVMSKQITKSLFVTSKLKEITLSKSIIHPGDGDGVFT